MAIAASLLIASGLATAATSFTTASISPTANKLILLAVGSANVASNNAPTVTGAGMTWTQVATSIDSATRRRVTLFRALSASPGSGALTIDFAGTTHNNCQWSVIEFSGIDTGGTNGANAIVQSVTNTSTGGTSATVTLAAFGAAGNATFGALRQANGTGISPGSGFAELHETVFTGTLESEFRNDNDTSVDWTWSGSSIWNALAVEIKAGTTPPTAVAGAPFNASFQAPMRGAFG